jgi:hypothetical protein
VGPGAPWVPNEGRADSFQAEGANSEGEGEGEGENATHQFTVSRPPAATPSEVSSRHVNRPCPGPGECLHYIRRMGLMDVEFAAGVGTPSRVAG